MAYKTKTHRHLEKKGPPVGNTLQSSRSISENAPEKGSPATLTRSERRLHQRFTVKEGAFVVIRTGMEKIESIQNMSMGEIALAVFRTKPSRIGQIKDMSESGLCFEYVSDKEDQEQPLKLDILLAERGFWLNDLDFKTISDADSADAAPYEPVRTKQSGIQFINLTHMQKEMLDAFLKNHTKGTA